MSLVANNNFTTGLTNWNVFSSAFTPSTDAVTTGVFFTRQAVQFNQNLPYSGNSTDLVQTITGLSTNTDYRIAFEVAINAAPGEFVDPLLSVTVGTYGVSAPILTFNKNAPAPTIWPFNNVQTYYVVTQDGSGTELTWNSGSNTQADIIFSSSTEEQLFTITNVWFSTNAFCYNEGTQILCINSSSEEEYTAIEDIRVGHLVKTYKHGAKAVTHIGKGEMMNWHSDPVYCMYKLPKTDDMIDDLIVLGGHSILVDKYESEEQEQDCIYNMGRIPKLEDKFLLLAKSSTLFTKMPEGEKYTYYHLVLDNTGNEFVHYGIWANGVLSESCSEVVFTHHNLVPLS